MTLEDALQSIYDRRGFLTPAAVVEEAHRNRSEAGKTLHEKLEWDNRVAGHKYRVQQAHELIQSCRVTYREATEDEAARSVRGFHAVHTEKGHVYEPLDKVTQDPFLRQMLLRDMEREWKAMHRRYHEFEEFSELVASTMQQAA